MNTLRSAFIAISPLMLVSVANAAPIDLTVDPAQSSLDMTITVDIGIANSTDSDSTTLSGNIEIELDDDNNPLNITLNDLIVNMDQTMNFNWSFGFFGSADATLTNGVVTYATPGIPTGPVPIIDNSFTFSQAPFGLGGLLTVNYDLFGAGSGTEITDLSTQAPQNSDFAGTVMIVGDTITMTATLPLDSVEPLFDSNGNEIGSVTTVGIATVVATGTIQTCPADINNDGELNFFDVSAFLNAFAAQDPAADFNGDGAYNFFDVSDFLGAFTAGCP